MGKHTLWTKELVLESSKRFRTPSDWKKADRNATIAATKYGWYKDATAHMTRAWSEKWNKKAVLADARKYTNKSDWGNQSSGAYSSAKRNGWYEEATAHMVIKIISWNKEKVMEDAKKYKTRGEWFTNSKSYSIARNNGWVEEATAHMITTYSYGELVIFIYLLERDIAFSHQKKFKDLKHINALPFDFYLTDFNLLIEYNGIQHKRGWQGNKDDALEIQKRDALKKEYAKQNNYHYLAIECAKEGEIIAELEKTLKAIYRKLKIPFSYTKRELSQAELSKIANLGRFTKEDILESARQFKTLSNWKNARDGTYQKALQMGWKEEASKHMTSPIKKAGFWTKEQVIKSAADFTNQTSWKAAYGGAWRKAVNMGWIPEATAHMPYKKAVKPSGYWTKEKVLKSAKHFETPALWRKHEPSAVSVASNKGWLSEATAHMKNSSKPKI